MQLRCGQVNRAVVWGNWNLVLLPIRLVQQAAAMSDSDDEPLSKRVVKKPAQGDSAAVKDELASPAKPGDVKPAADIKAEAKDDSSDDGALPCAWQLGAKHCAGTVPARRLCSAIRPNRRVHCALQMSCRSPCRGKPRRR